MATCLWLPALARNCCCISGCVAKHPTCRKFPVLKWARMDFMYMGTTSVRLALAAKYSRCAKVMKWLPVRP